MADIDKKAEPHEEVTFRTEPKVLNARELMEIAKSAALAELRAQRERHKDLWLCDRQERPAR